MSDVDELAASEATKLFPDPKKGDLALFDGWTVWPFDKNDPVAVYTTQLSGISVYEWDGAAWVKQVPA